MAYNVLLSFAMIPFDLVLLYNLYFQHRATTPYHGRMRRALLFLTLSCLADVITGTLLQGFLPSAENRQVTNMIVRMPVAIHLVAVVWVAVYVVSFFRYTKKEQRLEREAVRLTAQQKWLLYPALLLTVIALWYETFAETPVMLVPCGLSLLTYAFFFLTEFPMHDRLRRRLEELEEAYRRAQRAEATAAEENSGKNEFLTNMSHEIRTPLNAILGMDEMILRTSREENISAYAGDIRNAGNSLLAIVNDILDFSRIESGSLEVIREPYHLGYVLDTVWSMMKLRAQDKGIALEREIDEELPDGLLGDGQHLQQVLINLLNNAVKYTHKGHVTLRLYASERGKDRVTLCFEVEDTGIGLKEEDMEKLFQPYARFDADKNRGVEGTGLGLAITRNLISLMDGEIRVRSEYGKGSVFTVLLPQDVTDARTLAEYALAEKRDRSGETRRFFAPEAAVLAVDDTESNLRVAEQLLKQTMISVDTCLSGGACLERLREKTYDVILLDHMMPGMDGIETMKAARALPHFDAEQTKIIVLTANAIAGAREMYLAEGFDDYLSKPVESIHLEEMLMKYLPAGKLITASDPRYTDCLAKMQEEAARSELAQGEAGKAEMEILKQVRGVDLEEALRLCASPSILLATMSDFAESIDEEAALIRQYADEGDWKNYTIKVHALKSTAALIGAKALSGDARFLEGCGNAENTKEILEKTPKLLADYRAYHDYLAPVMQKDDAEDTREEISEDELEEAYEALRDFVEMHDFDSADYIMETLAGYRIPEDKRARYDSIRKAVRRVDRTKLLEELL